MKKNIIAALALSTVIFAACNNSGTKSDDGHNHDSAATAGEAMKHEAPSDESVVEIKPQFADVDGKVAASLKPIFDHYIHVKNGLAADNASEAAAGAKAMDEALAQVDKSAMTPDQQKLYTENEDDLKEHADHISKNGGNIEHQREHFVQMSEDVYALAKGFGGGQALYHDFCPMYDNNKGAMWLSESKEIKNPYFGDKMLTCGTIKEVIK
ncbi:DUF3347 domain-containing protein [Chitinophaga cymbidii]|uniref:DUF3347 domain-containing protein n=1 Tax=Chitinophaga cymbidii TaxID=1096750 RepID=A0A512RS79_9BACT|nr:DUF3347 domain-containing protein [Chitinophaga cymbidii]GEP98548.1 hypothetical protein CCY01nite_48080 [Chitinophaga cymbidii]